MHILCCFFSSKLTRLSEFDIAEYSLYRQRLHLNVLKGGQKKNLPGSSMYGTVIWRYIWHKRKELRGKCIYCPMDIKVSLPLAE